MQTKEEETATEKVFDKRTWYPMAEWLEGRDLSSLNTKPKIKAEVWKGEDATFATMFSSLTSDPVKACLTPAIIGAICDESPTWWFSGNHRRALFLFMKKEECFVAIVREKNMDLQVMEFPYSDPTEFFKEFEFKLVVAEP